MTYSEFDKEIKNVQEYYGKEYNDIQLKEIYKYFQNSTQARLNFIFSKSYQTYSYLPNLAQLIEVHRNTAYFQPTRNQKIINSNEKCKICNGKGFRLYIKKDKVTGYPYQYIAHCECPASYNYRFVGWQAKEQKNKSNSYINSYKNVLKREHDEIILDL